MSADKYTAKEIENAAEILDLCAGGDEGITGASGQLGHGHRVQRLALRSWISIQSEEFDPPEVSRAHYALAAQKLREGWQP